VTRDRSREEGGVGEVDDERRREEEEEEEEDDEDDMLIQINMITDNTRRDEIRMGKSESVYTMTDTKVRSKKEYVKKRQNKKKKFTK
jgi:hypothetical protein